MARGESSIKHGLLLYTIVNEDSGSSLSNLLLATRASSAQAARKKADTPLGVLKEASSLGRGRRGWGPQVGGGLLAQTWNGM